ncbi:sensor histidine kinase [Actinophytocola sp. NPDC049390]|uniref:sensor histidine kinase n=1 Tax=Actinophytocola sp. NPDC049390 TaxID=3363894 RepID=UPI0037BDFE65
MFVSFSLLGFLHVLFLDVGPGEVLLSFGCIAVLLLVQLRWYSRASTRRRSPISYGILAAQAALVYLPILIFGQAWVGMSGFLAGSVLLLLRPVAGWVSFGLIVASMAAAQLYFTGSLIGTIYKSISTVNTGLVVYGLSRLTALVVAVQDARSEMARVAVVRERLRFARDLHDVLGYSLSAITLKIELAHRLVDRAPQEAGVQLLESLEISRSALADARTVATGYRELSLDDERRSAVSVLQAAGVDVRVNVEHSDLPARVSTVLATALREGVTNLLRHSKAKQCSITIRQTDERVTLELVNDDVPSDSEASTVGARGGLDNLSVRAAEVGGTVTVEHEPRMFRLRVDIPLPDQEMRS